jgi:hypothetical protein
MKMMRTSLGGNRETGEESVAVEDDSESNVRSFLSGKE